MTMTVAELIEQLSRYDQDRVVYVGTHDAIAPAMSIQNDCFDIEVGPAVLVESEEIDDAG